MHFLTGITYSLLNPYSTHRPSTTTLHRMVLSSIVAGRNKVINNATMYPVLPVTGIVNFLLLGYVMFNCQMRLREK